MRREAKVFVQWPPHNLGEGLNYYLFENSDKTLQDHALLILEIHTPSNKRGGLSPILTKEVRTLSKHKMTEVAAHRIQISQDRAARDPGFKSRVMSTVAKGKK